MTERASGPASAGFSCTDVEYARIGGTPLLARLYRPDGDGPFPAVVSVHGGAWASGDRLVDAATAGRLAAAGVLVCSLDFRLPPHVRYPDPVADVHLGVRWLKAHAHELRAVPSVGGIGFSSGGHQLMLVALRPADPRYAAHQTPDTAGLDASLAFVVLCYAVLDPPVRYRMAVQRGMDHVLDGHRSYWPDEAAMEEGSPQRIVERRESAHLPPVLVVQGSLDGNLPADTAERFGSAYRQAGGQADVVYYPDAPHGFLRREPDSPQAGAAVERIIRFVHRHSPAPGE